MKKNVHVTHRKESNDWSVKKEGNAKPSKITKTKKEAEKAAKEIAKKEKSEVVIHNKDGKISDKDSYGNDPRSTKDKVH